MKKEKIFLKKFIITIIIIILIFISIILYSRYIGTTGLVIKEKKIVYENLPDTYHGLKIAQLTDLHYGTTFKEKELKKLVDELNLLKPDIVVITGDLIDGETDLSTNSINTLSKHLKNINVTVNKYIITGNHDYGYDEFNQIIQKSGFINLDSNYDLITKDPTNSIIISGIGTNLHGDTSIEEKTNNIDTYLLKFSGDENPKTDNVIKPVYSILLIHEPDYIKDINLDNYNLVLAGHSHNSQVSIPPLDSWVAPIGAKQYHKPYYKVNNTDLYISGGLGTSTYKFRLFNRPSINFYRLTNK